MKFLVSSILFLVGASAASNEKSLRTLALQNDGGTPHDTTLDMYGPDLSRRLVARLPNSFKSCPSSYDVSKGDCAAAGKSVGGVLLPQKVKRCFWNWRFFCWYRRVLKLVVGSWDNVPAGCSLQSGTNITYYNTNVNAENTAGYNPVCKASCYFCDRYIFTMFILMTHNSFAVSNEVASPNQNYGVGKQFRDGIRGFNFDIYWNSGKVIMKHGDWHSNVDYSTSVAAIVAEMNKQEYRNEFVLVQFQDDVGSDHLDEVLEPWGDKVIKNFDPNKKLGEYIILGKRVLLTSKYDRASEGMHNYEDLITENNYKWSSTFDDVDFGHRRGPKNSDTSAKMMNHFCGTAGTGSMVSSAIVNKKSRMLYDARTFKKQDYAKDTINVIMIDYYDTGNVFDAQRAIRNGDFNSGCRSDGSLCGIGSTCFECCNKHEYWYSKALTACGKEPCWGDGENCGKGTTCKRCCNGHEYWYGQAMTACGRERCWGHGTRCFKGTSCKRCCKGNSWHWDKYFTACD